MTDAEKTEKIDPPPAPPVSDGAKNLPSVFLKGEIEIFPGGRLPNLDQGTLKAYAARAKDGTASFALICDRALTPRISMVQKYVSVNTPYLPKLIGAGVVEWPLEGQDKYVFIYENKCGNPVAKAPNIAGVGVRSDYVIGTVVRNLVEVLKNMQDTGITHGNIRLQNLYDGQGNGLEKVMLGECLAAPPGYFQPALYEPIERGLTTALGRGQAGFADDIYAFGVTLAVLVRQHDPMEGLNDQDIVLHKIEHGSFASLISKDRLPAQMLELLRGILNDDVHQRWTVDDILTWMDGRRVSPRQGFIQTSKASRPLEFRGEKILRPAHLAIRLPKEPGAAIMAIENGDVYVWLNRSLQDKECEKRYEEAIESANNSGNSANLAERSASMVAMALAPGFPIQYRGLSFQPEAFGRLLVDAILTKKDTAPYVEQIQGGMAMFWSKMMLASGRDSGDSVTKLENCRNFLRQSVMGYGLERCVYYLAPETQCLSEKLKNFCVRTPEDLLMAFEKIASGGDRPAGFFDRHIVAFLSVRDKAAIDPFIPDLNASEKHRQISGTLRAFALIQKRAKIGPVPNLSSWISDNLGSMIDRFHDRDQRKRYREQLAKIRDKGDLGRLADLFNTYQVLQDDMKMFTTSMVQYQAVKSEYEQLGAALRNDPKFGHDTGYQAASLVSGIVAAIVIFLFLLFRISTGHSGVF